MEVLYAKAAIKAIKAMDKPSKQRVKQARNHLFFRDGGNPYL